MGADQPAGGEARRFLGRFVPDVFEHRVVTIPAGSARAYDEHEWRDAIVVVEQGEIELEALDGERHRFGRGALIWLDGVAVRSIRSGPAEPVVLVAVARRAARISACPDRRRP